MKYLSLLIVTISILLTGCATDNSLYYSAIKTQAEEMTKVKQAQYTAMQAMAGDSDAAKVAAVMMIGMSQAQNSAPTIQAPRSFADHALQWAGILVPSIMQGYGIRQNALTSQNASDNSRLLGISTNEAFVGMAGKIQAPVAPQANITTTNTNTIGGDGNVGSGSQSKTDRHDTTTTDRHDVFNDDHSIANPAPIAAP